MRFGKLAPKHDVRTLRFASFLHPELPPPPPAYDGLARVVKALGLTESVKALFPLYRNDSLGDCTIAARYHLATLWNGFLGRRFVAPEDEVVACYERLSGGQDDGLNMLDVLRDWRVNPAGADTILAYVSIDHKDWDQVRRAISMFGAVYVGFQVTDECEAQFTAGIPWTPGTLTEDGHAVMIPVYRPDDTMLVSTWGAFQNATRAWFDQTVDECWAVLPAEATIDGFMPGMDVDKLQAALNSLG